jgi:hypothetical protein
MTCAAGDLGYNPGHNGKAQSAKVASKKTKKHHTESARDRREAAQRCRHADRDSARARRAGNAAGSRAARPGRTVTKRRRLPYFRPAPLRGHARSVPAPRSMGKSRRAHRSHAHATFPPLECGEGRAPHLARRHLLEANRLEWGVGGLMFLLISNPWTDTQPMPKAVQLFFFVAGLFLILVDWFRIRALRREWKDRQATNRQGRFKLSATQQIESNLYWLGWMVCWTVWFPGWWMRASFAGLALVMIAGLLYRNNLRAPDTSPFDPGSVLDLKNGRTTHAHEQR